MRVLLCRGCGVRRPIRRIAFVNIASRDDLIAGFLRINSRLAPTSFRPPGRGGWVPDESLVWWCAARPDPRVAQRGGHHSPPPLARRLGFTASLAYWLRRPPRVRRIPGSNPACAGIFFRGRVIPVTSRWVLYSCGYPVRRLAF